MALHRRTVLWALGALAAAGAALEAPRLLAAESAADAPRISGVEARQKVEKKEAVLLDVRSRAAFEAQHAEGAVHIPLAELEARLGELPKDKLVAAYCT